MACAAISVVGYTSLSAQGHPQLSLLVTTVICLSGLPAAGSSGACSRNVVCKFSGQAFETEIF